MKLNRDVSEYPTSRAVKSERGSPITTRDWDSYIDFFGLPDKYSGHWAGKRILDVGSGGKWADPEDAFPGATVSATDPEFGKGGRVKWNSAHEKRPGIAQNLPYPDNMFDYVLSSHAVPQHIAPVDFPKTLSEMLRVQKPNGEIRLTPCVKGPDISDNIEDALVTSGFEVDYTRQPGQATVTIIKPRNSLDKSAALKKFNSLMGL